MFEKSGLTKNAHGQKYFLFFLRKVNTVKVKPGSPGLQADSIPTALSGKLLILIRSQ